jgi:hypothetical protein
MQKESKNMKRKGSNISGSTDEIEKIKFIFKTFLRYE